MKRAATAGLAIAVLVGIGTPVHAQQGIAPEVKEKKEDEKRVLEVGKWYPSLEGGVNLTQAAFSENWKGGETGSVSWNAFLNGSAEKQMNEGLNWLNTMRLLYGQTRRQEVDTNGDRSWGNAEKSADLIEVESMFRLTHGWAVDPYFSARFESYFQDVTDPYGRSLYFNPMTFKESAGIARKFIDDDNQQLLTRIGATARETHRNFFVSDTGNATTSQTAWDIGGEWVTDYKKHFDDRVTYESRVSIYKPFTWSKKDVFDGVSADSLRAAGLDPNVGEYTTATDVDWQNTLTSKVTKFISFNLYFELLYDKYDNTIVPVAENGALTNPGAVNYAVRKKGQFKESFGIGLTVRFK